jgi:hypothetical protein
MGLPRKATTGCFEKVMVNVYDLLTKKVVFTGGTMEAAKFMNIPHTQMPGYLKSKSRVRKKWAVRIANVNHPNKQKDND